ncbi:VCBS repeat-containing protein [Aquirufa antheringensis]
MLNRISVLAFTFIFFSCTKEIIQQRLTVDWTPMNGGTVSPPTNAFERGSVVSMIATPAGEYTFKQWSGSLSGTNNPASITMDADKQVTGVFEKRQYPLTLTIEGSGTVKEEVIAIAPQAQYPSGTTVRLTPQPADKFEFGGWSGDLTSTSNPLDLKIDKAISLKALFQQIKFPGYKVQPFVKLQEAQYWRDCGVVWDVIMKKFGKSPSNGEWNSFFPQIITGDFNKDGWIDIFNPGTGSFQGNVFDNLQWLIWNPTLKTFENKNLFVDKSFKKFGGNQRRSVSSDLNNDGYTDVVIFDHGDDIPVQGAANVLQPIRIVLSNSTGEYTLNDISATPKIEYNHSGDIGDLNGDGKLDMVIMTGDKVFISYGESQFPFWGKNVVSFEAWNASLPQWQRDIAGSKYNATICDINNDGENDIIFGGGGGDRLLINRGKGNFNESSLIRLPKNPQSNFFTNDFRVVDINSDGLNDIVLSHCLNYDNWGISAYIQTSKEEFVLDDSVFKYTINTKRNSGQYGTSWKPWLIHYDFNNDGIKDFSYIDPHNYWNNSLQSKSVFIKNGGKYEEQDFYQFDEFAKNIKP